VKKLSEARNGESVIVVGIEGGERLKIKLSRLGIIPGTEVRVKKNSIGPIIVEVRGVNIAIGRGMAQKIIVEDKDLSHLTEKASPYSDASEQI